MNPERRPPGALHLNRPILGWAMYDFANSGYTTVVLTALYNAYFVGVVAQEAGTGRATLLWTLALGISNSLVIVTAPLLGALADALAAKKRFLGVTTVLCVLSTAGLGFTGPGAVALAMGLIIVSNLAFATGENLISAFLPEVAPPGRTGRVSAFGWSLGYFGGILVLALCLGAIELAGRFGLSPPEAVPLAMGIVALSFGLASLPTFLWVPEIGDRSVDTHPPALLRAAAQRLRQTWRTLGRYRDLRWFLAASFAYASGTFTVIVLAAVYAQEVFGFGTRESLALILILNLAGITGALTFGQLQDRWGSVRALASSLGLWVVFLGLAYGAQSRLVFWIAAVGIGLALGGSQTVGRALMGQLTPLGRMAEFYGFWGMVVRLSAIVGPVSYGLIAEFTGGDLRRGLIPTAGFFLVGLLAVLKVNEGRGRATASAPSIPPDETV